MCDCLFSVIINIILVKLKPQNYFRLSAILQQTSPHCSEDDIHFPRIKLLVHTHGYGTNDGVPPLQTTPSGSVPTLWKGVVPPNLEMVRNLPSGITGIWIGHGSRHLWGSLWRFLPHIWTSLVLGKMSRVHKLKKW